MVVSYIVATTAMGSVTEVRLPYTSTTWPSDHHQQARLVPMPKDTISETGQEAV